MTDIVLAPHTRPVPVPAGEIMPWAVFGSLLLLVVT